MKYQCILEIGQAKAGHTYKVLSTERTPDGDSIITDDTSGSNFKIKSKLLQDRAYFTRIDAETTAETTTEEPTATTPEVRIVLAEAHRVQAGDALFVTIDPQFADYADDVQECLRSLGVEKALVLPIPKGAVQFFAIEETITVSVDPALMQLAPNEDKKDV